MLKPNHQCDGMWRWVLWEALQGVPVFLLPHVCEPGNGLASATKSASTLILDFPVSRTMGKILLSVYKILLYGIYLLQQYEQTKTEIKLWIQLLTLLIMGTLKFANEAIAICRLMGNKGCHKGSRKWIGRDIEQKCIQPQKMNGRRIQPLRE